MLKETTDVVIPESDFTEYTTFKSIDGSGKEAKATQEDLLIWVNNDSKGLLWKTQFDLKQTLKMDMKLARETMTFIYGESQDLTGCNDDKEIAIIKDNQPGEGGSFIMAQRWVHDLNAFAQLPSDQQEMLFGRIKIDSKESEKLSPHTQVGNKDQMTRRSTPYSFHDGTVGLYFMGFCAKQGPLIENEINVRYGWKRKR